jgi:hypothetical protein
MFKNFNINTFNFNVEVGEKTIFFEIIDFEVSRQILEIVIPDLWSSFSVASYNELAGTL